ncbi:unnamed protein product [Plutella xylostella]|uniref:(diamondback moth) hypothetical protein n=1 Tax=Plutella xylostella TaxID=51655 RepID=A0A8S4EBW8_PLUXY|nr:unnamed protein product [Plutella xylostella]
MTTSSPQPVSRARVISSQPEGVPHYVNLVW